MKNKINDVEKINHLSYKMLKVQGKAESCASWSLVKLAMLFIALHTL